MHSTSLHVGYPRSPFKFTAFINALLFLCHTSGLKLFLGGSVLLRLSSNARLHSRYLLQPSTNAGLLPSFNAGMYPSSNAVLCIRSPTPDCIRAPTPDYVQAPMLNYIRGPTPKYIRAPTPDCVQDPMPDYIRGVISPWFKKVEGV